MKTMAISLLFFLPTLAYPQINRCEENGTTVYRSEPCKVQKKGGGTPNVSIANAPANQMGQGATVPKINPETGLPYSSTINTQVPASGSPMDVINYLGRVQEYVKARKAENAKIVRSDKDGASKRELPKPVDPEYSYQGSSGAKYKYDLNRPGDQIRYSLDPAAQLRDSTNIDPRRGIDRSLGQQGGGVQR